MNIYANILAANGRGLRDTSGNVNLKGSWDDFAQAVNNATGLGSLLELLSIVGMLIVAAAFIKWGWDRRKSGLQGAGQGGGGLMGALIVGLILAAPGFVIPAVLGIFDIFINALVRIWNSTV